MIRSGKSIVAVGIVWPVAFRATPRAFSKAGFSFGGEENEPAMRECGIR
nr:hypothetical protein RVX_0265 [Nitratidesulfovibrio sp. HK-II]